MKNKIGELVVDWDALEVGDKAVFEGFVDQYRSHWGFTVGKVYTVGVDEYGDKGFISDEDITPEDAYADAFNFRLLSKAPTTIEEDVEQSFPDFHFKIKNGDNSAVRQWLKDNGVVWCDGDENTFDFIKEPNLYIDVIKKEMNYINEGTPKKDIEEFKEAPEISVNIQPAVVTGWGIVENISEKELQLKEKIAKLTTELEEAQEELNNL